MTERVHRNELQVSGLLARLIEEDILAGTGIDPKAFWTGFADIVHTFGPRNRALLAERARLKTELDRWHREHPGPVRDVRAYRAFLERIGYLVPDPGKVDAKTAGVDPEISEQAGPQLVVPVSNARYAVNAANARWGSLYDALYGTDAIPDSGATAKGDAAFNLQRGKAVIARGRVFLDSAFPLVRGSHADATGYAVKDGRLSVRMPAGDMGLADPAQFRGYQGGAAAPSAILLRNHGIHAELQFDRDGPIGGEDAAGMKDIVLEAALTTIMD
jgi:malate synthase